MKRALNLIIKTLLLTAIIFVSSSKSMVLESKVNNDNLDKNVNLAQMALKINEFKYDEKYGAKDTFVGDLTGYVYNCPACTGHLACYSKYDLSNGTITYDDEVYGEVRIVASSANLPCGTIIRFSSKRISDDPIYAIVLDRGVLGNAIDLLSIDYEYATRNVGRSSITYDVLRFGW